MWMNCSVEICTLNIRNRKGRADHVRKAALLISSRNSFYGSHYPLGGLSLWLNWETWVQSLGWEDLLEKGKATPSSIWPGEFHGLYSPWGRKESDMTERFSLHLPIRCSCYLHVSHTLELPRFSNATQLLFEMVGRSFLLIGRDTVVFKKSAN